MRDLFAALVARRLWVYGGGLGVVLLARSTLAVSTGRSILVAVALSAMVVTYAGELWLDADAAPIGRVTVTVGAVGVAAGVWLTLGGDLRGLLFLAGGLLFLNRGLGGSGGDERMPDDSTHEDAIDDDAGGDRP